MTHWQAWIACGLLTSLPAAAQADIFRWDNGQLIPGTEDITPSPAVDLTSYMGEWSSPQRNLGFADFSGGLDLTQANFSHSWLDDSRFNGANLTRANLFGANLTNADLSGTNLTNARLGGFSCPFTCIVGGTILTNANLAGAVVAGANFGSGFGGSGITLPQLYSTASYQQKNLRGIGLSGNELTDGDFSGQDFTGADLNESTLTNANLSGTNLTNTELHFATLTNANLAGANLTGADFLGSTLTSANFAGAVVAGAAFSHHDDLRGSGIAPPQLYSTASYQQRDLRGIGLGENDLTGWDFNGQDLTGAYFFSSTLTNANLSGTNLTNAFLARATLTNANLSGTNLTDAVLAEVTLTNANLAGAIVTGAIFHTHSFTSHQLYSTASYQQKNLRGIRFNYNDLTGWDFSGQDLAGADFGSSTLPNANFSFADLRGAAFMDSGPSQLTRNTIRAFGAINGLDLKAGETLVVRDSGIGITVNDRMNVVSGGTLELVLADADWGSTMAVASGVTPDLGGTLRVRFADQANLAPLLGATFDFFNWPTALDTNNRFDAIELPPGTLWDFSQLYLTGTAKLTAIPEPSTILLLACGTAACAVARRRMLANSRGQFA